METPSLNYLLESYFHQDFYEVNGGVWETVDAFVRKDPHRAAHVPEEIAVVLNQLPSEEAVAEFVDSTGCEYLPPADAGGYSEWLREVARRVRAAVAVADEK